jgi:DnaJ family protein B protein 12
MNENNNSEIYKRGLEAFKEAKYEEALGFLSSLPNKDDTINKLIAHCKEKLNTNIGGNEDVDCDKILNTKDYYEILGVPKDSSDDEIRKAYKKLAIKFHPDKNKSEKADGVFKKISHAFSHLKDPEKRAFYNEHGTEEDFRERHAQHYAEYHEEDIDPFDLFEMFFNGGQMNGQFRRQRQQRVFRRRNHEAENVPLRPVGRIALLIQLLPFLLIILYSFLPYIFDSVIYLINIETFISILS